MTKPAPPPRQLGVTTAALLVVASMIGTGVFTTTGYLVGDIGHGLAVLVAWGLGGVAALFGALAFAELAAALPRNGGEYALLGRIYHPGVGFIAGWVSLVVGFSAPVAASAIAFGEYAKRAAPGLPEFVVADADRTPMLLGLVVIVVTSAIHIARVREGSRFQNVLTGAKAALIVGFIAAGLLAGDPSLLLTDPARPLGVALRSPELAVGLVYIAFSYSGWNAAVYVAGEVEAPEKNLPRALIAGTGLVTLLYLGLNAVFLMAAPASELAGELRVGDIAATALWGEVAGRGLSALIALGLVSTVGALVMTGPRVYEAMGRDHAALRVLVARREGGGPVVAVVLQGALSMTMAVTASFDVLLEYIGLTLSLLAGLTAAGVFVLRRREPNLPRPYRVTGYPVTPLVFLALTAWMIVHTVAQDLGGEVPADAGLFELPGAVTVSSLVTLGTGALLYFVLRPRR